jgi:hypothetical protein
MNLDVPNNVGLTERELCEAVTMWLRRMGRPLSAVKHSGSSISMRGSIDFEVKRLTTEEEHYEHETDAEVLRLLRLRKRTEAVMYHRGRTGYGLRESKDHVDRIANENQFFF